MIKIISEKNDPYGIKVNKDEMLMHLNFKGSNAKVYLSVENFSDFHKYCGLNEYIQAILLIAINQLDNEMNNGGIDNVICSTTH